MKNFEEIREACWKGYKQVGTKKKGGKDVPNCVPEDTDTVEGRYTKNDGGAFDGLRIAKYLAHEDGKSWRRLGYGDTEGYLQAAAALLKKDKSRARDILSQPTPRD